MKSHWDTDAHFVTYVVKDRARWPRLNKPSLPCIRALGCDVLTTMLVLDYDNPNHEPWKPGQIDQFITKLADMEAAFPLLGQWTCLYTTAGGAARFVYVYSEPVEVLTAERKNMGMVAEFKKHGLDVDAAVFDWTRAFRLPYVKRDGVDSWSNNLTFEYWEQPG